MAKKSKKRVSESVQEPKEPVSTETRVRRAEVEPSGDNHVIRNAVILVLVLLGLYLLFGFFSGRDNQANNDKSTEDESSQVEKSDEAAKDHDESTGEGGGSRVASGHLSAGTTVNETDKAYSYTVGEGESYTAIARHAVASISGGLAPAERVAAETKLAVDAGAGLLDIGQNLSLSKDDVRAAIDWAKGLGAEQKAAWQPYADLVAW